MSVNEQMRGIKAFFGRSFAEYLAKGGKLPVAEEQAVGSAFVGSENLYQHLERPVFDPIKNKKEVLKAVEDRHSIDLKKGLTIVPTQEIMSNRQRVAPRGRGVDV